MKQFDITLWHEVGASGLYHVFITNSFVLEYEDKYASLN